MNGMPIDVLPRWLMVCASLAAPVGVLGYAAEAWACGGTFCDAGPTVMPVDQSGENILFVRDGESIEAHIQIQYDGDAESFAWLVPMMAVPEVEVGSEPLFRALLDASVPTFTIATRTEGDCGGGGGGCGAKREDATAAGGGNEGDFGQDGPDPDVVAKGTAGAFEYAVLEGGTTAGVIQWLDDNGYAGNPQAAPILDEYLQAGFVFVAFKLRGGAGIDEIHPVVLRYVGTEPCVPIRLTRIAAKDDMGIRAFFLGEHRVAPTNYRHVRINPIRIDWTGLAANYEQVVTLAVDEDEAAGHAFVTEYAGTSDLVAADAVDLPGLDGTRFVGLLATLVVSELQSQGVMQCPGGVGEGLPCQALHPLVGALLEEFFPTPAGVEPEQWWSDMATDAELNTSEWPSPDFAARFEERIAGPAQHAGDLLRGHPYLTRLFTTMSPAEMTEDPTFHENAELPEVTNLFSATVVSDCDGPIEVELDDGRIIRYDDDGNPPSFDGMPYAVAIEQVPSAGAPMLLLDHAAAIDEELEAWNASHGAGCGCRIGTLRLDGLLLFGLFVLGLRGRRRHG